MISTLLTKKIARSVYTTGKGSTGVGLTATVNRDNATGEVAAGGSGWQRLVIKNRGISSGLNEIYGDLMGFNGI